jgi:hypothetical protein
MKSKEELAGIYLRCKCQLDSLDHELVEEFRAITKQAFDRLNQIATFSFVDYDPYESLFDLTASAVYGRIKIYSGDNNSRLLPGDLNLYSRAIHDWIHYFHQLPFGFEGECKVYEIQKLLYPESMWPLLYSEIVLQTAFVEVYGYFPEQKVIVNI